jgi:prolyl oligopeptidase
MTKLSDVVDNYFGVEVADPYRWLENTDDPAVREWIEEQNRRTRSRLDAIACRDEIADRLRTLWNYPRATAPFCRGGRYFWSENDGLQNQNVYYMSNAPLVDGVSVLDVNTLAADGVVALSVLSVSPCGRYIGYGISKCGSD